MRMMGAVDMLGLVKAIDVCRGFGWLPKAALMIQRCMKVR
jgi:hypothetical protein